MDEAKKLVRFTLPALVFFIPLGSSYLILHTGDEESMSIIHDLLRKFDLISLIGAFILSGGVGYIFSIIYFGWIRSYQGAIGKTHNYDHTAVLNDLVNQGKIKIVRFAKGEKEDFKPSNEREAWHIFNTLWHRIKSERKQLMGVNDKLEPYYSDFVIGLGVSFTALIFSFCGLFILINSGSFDCKPICECVFGYLFLLVMLWINYSSTRSTYQAMMNTAFGSIAMDLECCKSSDEQQIKTPIEVVYYE